MFFSTDVDSNLSHQSARISHDVVACKSAQSGVIIDGARCALFW